MDFEFPTRGRQTLQRPYALLVLQRNSQGNSCHKSLNELVTDEDRWLYALGNMGEVELITQGTGITPEEFERMKAQVK